MPFKIKMICSSIIVLLFFCPPVSAQEKNNFTLRGTAKGLEGKSLYLGYRGWGLNRIWDSTKVNSGKFEFKGHIAPQWKCFLSTNPHHQSDENITISLYMEPGNMTIDLNADKFYEAVLKGSKINDVYVAFERKKMSSEKLWAKLYGLIDSLDNIQENTKDSLMLLNMKTKQEIFQKKADSISVTIKQMNKQFILVHPSSIAAVCLLQDIKNDYLPNGELDTLYSKLSVDNRSTPYATMIQTELDRFHITVKDKPAPLFRSRSLSGDTISLEQFRGKYVLLDFWGSWCGPCRKALPGLIELYKKYHDKGIEFISISARDNEGQWAHSVNYFGINIWVNIMAEDMKPEINKLYGVTSYPTMILISPEGKVINNFTSQQNEQELPAMLAKYLP